jgi:hypothetical protein
MKNKIASVFAIARSEVTSADAAQAIRTNAAVTMAYSKNNSANQPLVMIAHDLKGGMY